MMDIFGYKPSEQLDKTSACEFTNVFTGELFMTLDVRSMYCVTARNAATIRDKVIADDTATDEQKEEANNEFIASLIAGWKLEPDSTFGGEKLEYTHKNAKLVVSKSKALNGVVLTHSGSIKNYGDAAKKS